MARPLRCRTRRPTGEHPAEQSLSPQRDGKHRRTTGGIMSDLILVAEDDADVRELFAFALRSAGFRVVTAKDGNTAARIITVAAPRVVVTDLRMPALNGIELCQLVRR